MLTELVILLALVVQFLPATPTPAPVDVHAVPPAREPVGEQS